MAITDLKMPRMDGLSLIRAMRSARCETPVVVMTAFGTIGTAVEAMKLGACDYIQKPFEADAICGRFASAPGWARNDRPEALPRVVDHRSSEAATRRTRRLRRVQVRRRRPRASTWVWS